MAQIRIDTLTAWWDDKAGMLIVDMRPADLASVIQALDVARDELMQIFTMLKVQSDEKD